MKYKNMNFLMKLMDRNKFRGISSKFETISLWLLIPLVILDMIIHPERWDDFYDDDFYED